MNKLIELLKSNDVYNKRQLSIAEAIAEANAVEKILVSLSELQQAKPSLNPINCLSYWNPLYGTFTYHTHTVVDNFGGKDLEKIAALFFNAYSLQKQDWYSQFVSGENKPLPKKVDSQNNIMLREQQIGQGYFDFGMPTLRHYHTLFSLRHISKNAVSIVLRSIDYPFEIKGKSKKVFLLAPTGDYFFLKEDQLYWHHICTVTGISLLPGVLDKYFMNCLRYLKLDSKERQTYKDEAKSFIQFASTF